MGKLRIGTIESGRNGMKTMMIDGLTDAELKQLKSMEHASALDLLLEWVDARNDGIGTAWQNGYGIYGFWFDNECAFVNIGDSCD